MHDSFYSPANQKGVFALEVSLGSYQLLMLVIAIVASRCYNNLQLLIL